MWGVYNDGCQGTTSACAENTLMVMWTMSAKRNYLRVRGEYAMMLSVRIMIAELPPRARRIHLRNFCRSTM